MYRLIVIIMKIDFSKITDKKLKEALTKRPPVLSTEPDIEE